ncbi:hypothetical protein ABFX02_06G135300 [Erythranthe guttata]
MAAGAMSSIHFHWMFGIHFRDSHSPPPEKQPRWPTLGSTGKKRRRHLFKVDVPGLKKEEVKVEVEDGSILQISGERSKEKEEKNDKWHRVERSSGKFIRRFRLPENAKLEEVKAAMENGVLTVTVPKEEVKKPEVKAIDISG